MAAAVSTTSTQSFASSYLAEAKATRSAGQAAKSAPPKPDEVIPPVTSQAVAATVATKIPAGEIPRALVAQALAEVASASDLSTVDSSKSGLETVEITAPAANVAPVVTTDTLEAVSDRTRALSIESEQTDCPATESSAADPEPMESGP